MGPAQRLGCGSHWRPTVARADPIADGACVHDGSVSQLRALIAAAAVVALAVAAGCSAPQPAPSPATPADTASAAPSPSRTTRPPKGTGDQPEIVAQAHAILGSLPVKGRAPKTEYDREEQFGSAWIDVDANGCDTRNDILQRDLTNTQCATTASSSVGCSTIRTPGSRSRSCAGPNSSDVQIDHVVALSNAWQTGAQQLTYQERVAFANDPLGLLAVDGSLNQQKGDGDAATWLPPNRSFWCEYVSIQVLVKERWRLWLTPPEHATIERILDAC